ncbi:glutathione synthetase ATP-binding domain-like protein [Aspergillus udagawae]|nr:glutathione synthetase ATP-binding domain-like protein [Aspergillus udagawae]
MLETYILGLELDANFVLLDGAVLFLKVTDNFPCSEDDRSATLAANFAETLQISNTRFPAREVEAIREKLSRSLRALGFRSGVFHVEARMRNSAVRYERVDVRDGDGESPPAPQPDPFLIEVNVCPPGTGGTRSTLYTYGVDLGALQLLRALSSPLPLPGGHHPGDGGACSTEMRTAWSRCIATG